MQEGTGARQRHSWAVFGAVEAQREVCGTQCKAGRKGRERGSFWGWSRDSGSDVSPALSCRAVTRRCHWHTGTSLLSCEPTSSSARPSRCEPAGRSQDGELGANSSSLNSPAAGSQGSNLPALSQQCSLCLILLVHPTHAPNLRPVPQTTPDSPIRPSRCRFGR